MSLRLLAPPSLPLPTTSSLIFLHVGVSTSTSLRRSILLDRSSDIDSMFAASPPGVALVHEKQSFEPGGCPLRLDFDLCGVTDACACARACLQRLEDAVFECDFKCGASCIPHLVGVQMQQLSTTDVVINEVMRRPCTSSTHLKVLSEVRATFGDLLPDLVAFFNKCVGTQFETFNDVTRNAVLFAQSTTGDFTLFDTLHAVAQARCG